MSVAAVQLSGSESCWTRVQKCLCPKNVIEIALCCGGGVGGFWIPIPFLKGLVTGSMIFMAVYQMAKHPSAKCVSDCRPMQGRTWKHISAGTVLSGGGCGFGLFSRSLQFQFGYVLGMVGGPLLGLMATYTNILFDAQPPSEEEAAPV